MPTDEPDPGENRLSGFSAKIAGGPVPGTAPMPRPAGSAAPRRGLAETRDSPRPGGELLGGAGWETETGLRGEVHAVLVPDEAGAGGGGARVAGVAPDGQLHAAGVCAGAQAPRLLGVDQEAVAGRSLTDIHAMIAGGEGSRVNLQLERGEGAPQPVEVSVVRTSAPAVDAALVLFGRVWDVLATPDAVSAAAHPPHSNPLVERAAQRVLDAALRLKRHGRQAKARPRPCAPAPLRPCAPAPRFRRAQARRRQPSSARRGRARAGADANARRAAAAAAAGQVERIRAEELLGALRLQADEARVDLAVAQEEAARLEREVQVGFAARARAGPRRACGRPGSPRAPRRSFSSAAAAAQDRDKTMLAVAADYDARLRRLRGARVEEVTAVSITLDEAFSFSQELFGALPFAERVRVDVAAALGADAARVEVVGMHRTNGSNSNGSNGSLIVDLNVHPPLEVPISPRPVRPAPRPRAPPGPGGTPSVALRPCRPHARAARRGRARTARATRGRRRSWRSSWWCWRAGSARRCTSSRRRAVRRVRRCARRRSGPRGCRALWPSSRRAAPSSRRASLSSRAGRTSTGASSRTRPRLTGSSSSPPPTCPRRATAG